MKGRAGFLLARLVAPNFRVKTYVDGGKRYADYRDLAAYLDEVRAGAASVTA